MKKQNKEDMPLSSGRRKFNSVLFVLGATALNIAIVVLVFFVLVVLYGRIFSDSASQQTSQIVVVIIFCVSVASAYFVYHSFVKFLSKRVDMDRYFDPIFSFRARNK